jgi:hypothetical protein
MPFHQKYTNAINGWLNRLFPDPPSDWQLRYHYSHAKLFSKFKPFIFVVAGLGMLIGIFVDTIPLLVRFIFIGLSLFIIVVCLYMPYHDAEYDRRFGEKYRQMLDRKKT